MRTILLPLLPALGACASTPATPAPPMPSARASLLADGAVPSTAAACLTRYTYHWLDLQIDCPTERVGGDPLHWVTSCAIPADFASHDLHGMDIPQLRYEATADELGYLLREVVDLPPDLLLGFIPRHDVSYVYDSQHRLSEMVGLDVNGVEIHHLVVGPRDGSGNPLSMTVTVPPLEVYGVKYPATSHATHVYTYDVNGRLIADHGTFSDGWAFWDASVSYEDAALRRDHVVIVDFTGELPDQTGAGHNTRQEFLDGAGRVLEDRNHVADGPDYVADNHYDGQGRLSMTTKAVTGGFTEKVDYIYECQ